MHLWKWYVHVPDDVSKKKIAMRKPWDHELLCCATVLTILKSRFMLRAKTYFLRNGKKSENGF